MTDKTTAERWYMLNKDGMAMLCADKADAEQEAIDAQAAWPGMGPHRAVQLVEAGASLPLPGAQEPVAPHGWLYDWTHSSATGRPDETYTGFTKDEQHARKHDNCTPVYTAPHPALSAGWRDIATAPKYTEHGAYHHLLLAYAPDEIHEEGFVSQGYWMEAEEDAPDNMGHDGGWVDVHFDFFSCGRSFGAEAYRSAGTQPTHWQPLPTSPSMDGESNADQA